MVKHILLTQDIQEGVLLPRERRPRKVFRRGAGADGIGVVAAGLAPGLDNLLLYPGGDVQFFQVIAQAFSNCFKFLQGFGID